MKRIGIATVPGQRAATPLYFERAARKAGYDVIPVTSLNKRIALRALDCVIVTDPFCGDPHGLRTVSCPTACYLTDVHVGLEDRLTYARYLDHVFIAQRDYLEQFAALPHPSVHWLPLACDPEIHFQAGQERIYEVGFAGNLGAPNSEQRATLTQILREFHTNDAARRYSPREMGYVYSRSKIVVNKSIDGELNARVFEGMASGALLIMDQVANGLDEIGTDGKHFVTYESAADAIEKVRYYLAHDGEREAIARRGQECVFGRHTYRQRLDQMFSIVAPDKGPCAAPVRSAPEKLERLWRSELLCRHGARLGEIETLITDGYWSVPVLRNAIDALVKEIGRILARKCRRLSERACATAMKAGALVRLRGGNRPKFVDVARLATARWWHKSFSQFGEDIPVNLYFRNRDRGYYVDVGSYHPRRHSNTHLLHRRGWCGVNVDISPNKMALFDYDRPRDQNFCCAVSDRSGELTAYVFGDDSLLNTIDRTTAHAWQKQFGAAYRETTLPTRTLTEILEESGLPCVDYLNIDVEGAEFLILKGLDFTRYRPQCISIEIHGNLEVATGSDVYKVLRGQGYELYAWVPPTFIFALGDFI